MKASWTGCSYGYRETLIRSISGIIKTSATFFQVSWFKDVALAAGPEFTSNNDIGALVTTAPPPPNFTV